MSTLLVATSRDTLFSSIPENEVASLEFRTDLANVIVGGELGENLPLPDEIDNAVDDLGLSTLMDKNLTLTDFSEQLESARDLTAIIGKI